MSSPIGFEPVWSLPAGVRAFATVRSGGVSSGAYASLNLGAHVGDSPGWVAENRARLQSAAGLPAAPVWLEQVHGAKVLNLEAAERGAADGSVTGQADTVCAVLTADCLPVLLCTRDGRRVGAAHAGWRGLLAGVLPAAVRALGVPPAEVLAWLGPAIGPAAYEVGAEVRTAYVGRDSSAAVHFTPNRRGRWQADLYGLARDSLAAAGVIAVSGGEFCTFAEPGRFFSHRRQAPCGRMATLIWIEHARR